MNENENREAVRQYLVGLGRKPTDQDVERIIQIQTRLENCELTTSQATSFGLVIQTYRNDNPAGMDAKAAASIMVAVLISDGDLEIVGNTVVLTEAGERWRQEQEAKGMGKRN